MPNTPKYRLPYPGPGDAPNGYSQIESLAEGVEAALASLTTAAKPYLPAFSGSSPGGTNSLGTGGTITGRYSMSSNGMIDWGVRIATGADFSGPIGSYRISLPMPAFCWTGGSVIVGSGVLIGGTNILATCLADPAVNGTAFQIGFHGSAGNAAVGNPVAWPSRVVLLSGRYEPVAS